MLKDAREIGQAATLMLALNNAAPLTHIHCGNYAAANAEADELLALADEKGIPIWKALGMIYQGCVLALAGNSNAIQIVNSGITAWRSTRATLYMPLFLPYLARAYAELGQFDDAWRCIGEAVTAVETTKERWCEAEINRIAGERTEGMIRGRCKPTSDIAISSTRCAMPNYRRRALRISGENDTHLRGGIGAKGVLMNRARQFRLLTICLLLAILWLPEAASAAQCGSTAASFEAWKRQFAGEAQARGVSASTIAALMATNYSTAHLMLLPMRPLVFDGIESGCVGRQKLQLDSPPSVSIAPAPRALRTIKYSFALSQIDRVALIT
jgi:hypothetical protein